MMDLEKGLSNSVWIDEVESTGIEFAMAHLDGILKHVQWKILDVNWIGGCWVLSQVRGSGLLAVLQPLLANGKNTRMTLLASVPSSYNVHGS
ncbi:hypothetical protein AXG93_2318s1310 [Marchantia polymorpha subsp. ruderalis]|uniref:Uncharacterized protein n=1 Tax=Marchantia polymorpha subsp. ruderalis TaxID=1480154 RepID=A0A176VN96_MARPO|nr:hypothetical protein AXG93_2318s1310 [Marchantia polymorpha subsp. ruderalis]